MNDFTYHISTLRIMLFALFRIQLWVVMSITWITWLVMSAIFKVQVFYLAEKKLYIFQLYCYQFRMFEINMKLRHLKITNIFRKWNLPEIFPFRKLISSSVSLRFLSLAKMILSLSIAMTSLTDKSGTVNGPLYWRRNDQITIQVKNNYLNM